MPKWKESEIRLLGKRTDKDVAEMIGRKKNSVAKMRIRLGISAFCADRAKQPGWRDEDVLMLGNASDVSIAKTTGRSKEAVQQARIRRGIPKFSECRVKE